MIARSRITFTFRHDGRGWNSISILDMTIPILKRCIGTPEPCLQFVQKELGVLSSQKLLKHIFRLAPTTFDIYSLEYGDDVLEKKLGIIGSTSDTAFGPAIYAQEVEDLQFPSNPFSGPTNKFFVSVDLLRVQISEARQSVRADM